LRATRCTLLTKFSAPTVEQFQPPSTSRGNWQTIDPWAPVDKRRHDDCYHLLKGRDMEKQGVRGVTLQGIHRKAFWCLIHIPERQRSASAPWPAPRRVPRAKSVHSTVQADNGKETPTFQRPYRAEDLRSKRRQGRRTYITSSRCSLRADCL